MTISAMQTLLAWASELNKEGQAQFAQFYHENYEAFANDEAYGADGSGTINNMMMKLIINEFEVKIMMAEPTFGPAEVTA